MRKSVNVKFTVYITTLTTVFLKGVNNEMSDPRKRKRFVRGFDTKPSQYFHFSHQSASLPPPFLSSIILFIIIYILYYYIDL